MGCSRVGEDLENLNEVSKKVVNNILFNHDIKLKPADALDPQRAQAASNSVLETFFKSLDNFIDMLHKAFPGKFPWKSFSEVLARNKYNMDELASDMTKNRNKVAIPESLMQE